MSNIIEKIRVEAITPGDNDREAFDPQGIRELADSIEQHGLAQPITVRPWQDGGYQLVAGERRWRAVQLLKWKVIPSIVRKLSDEAASGIMLLENIQRAELNPIEEAKAYHKRMVKFGWDAQQVAKVANVSVQRVRLRLALLDIVPEAQKLVRDGQLGLKYAYAKRDLDNHRQRIAPRYLAATDNPRIKEFRTLCAQLLEEQAQEALFDMAAFMTEIQEVRDAEREARPERIIPIAEDLPAMRKAGSIAQALERFIRDLMDAGRDREAQVAGSIYLGLLQHKLTRFPKGPSPLIPGETLQDKGVDC